MLVTLALSRYCYIQLNMLRLQYSNNFNIALSCMLRWAFLFSQYFIINQKHRWYNRCGLLNGIVMITGFSTSATVPCGVTVHPNTGWSFYTLPWYHSVHPSHWIILPDSGSLQLQYTLHCTTAWSREIFFGLAVFGKVVIILFSRHSHRCFRSRCSL